MFVTISAEEDMSHPDPIAFLLNKDGHVGNDNDVLFYNSNKKCNWERRGGADEVGISEDNAMIGPFCSEHTFSGFLPFRYLGIENDGFFLVNLDTICKDIEDIVFVEYDYDYKSIDAKETSHKGFLNLILDVEKRDSPLDDYNIRTFMELPQYHARVKIEDIMLEETCTSHHFISAKLKRNLDGKTWSYIPIWQKIESIEKVFNKYMQVI